MTMNNRKRVSHGDIKKKKRKKVMKKPRVVAITVIPAKWDIRDSRPAWSKSQSQAWWYTSAIPAM
jgi:hypothetical protein